MADFNMRSDSVNVEQIMDQIRSRIREKRGVDYTEEQIRELAAVKLQRFLDPRGVRSDLLEQYRRTQPPYTPPEIPNFVFEDHTMFDSHRGALRTIRRLLKPLLKLFFNPNPLIQALNIQSRVNTILAEREARLEASRRSTESLYYELIHNLVVETTRLGIEVKNLTMRVESMTSRLEFNERRARALEGSVVYRPAPGDIVVAAPPPPAPAGQRQPHEPRPQPAAASAAESGAPQQPRPAAAPGEAGVPGEGPGQRSRRRRRRRGRRGGAPAAAVMGAPAPAASPAEGNHSTAAESMEQAMGAESHSTEPAAAQAEAATHTAPPVEEKPEAPSEG